jgi:hypothetical protein
MNSSPELAGASCAPTLPRTPGHSYTPDRASPFDVLIASCQFIEQRLGVLQVGGIEAPR